jgi:hypothetical protein
MKKSVKTAILTVFMSSSFMLVAQNNNGNGLGNNQWKTNGNNADENHFIGTKNNYPLKFITSDSERIRLTTDGKFGFWTTVPEAMFDVNGDAIFRSNFKLPSIINADSTVQTFLLIKGDGTVTKGGLDHLKSLMYLDVNSTDGSCGDGGAYNDANPTWSNGLNKIYYKCPQIKVGIGTQNPNFTLHVNGTTYSSEYQGNISVINRGTFNQRLLVGTDIINTNYRLNVLGNSLFQGGVVANNLAIGTGLSSFSNFTVKTTTNAASIMVDQTEVTNDWTKIIYAEIQNPTTEIIKVFNPSTNQTPFLLSSSGKMEIHNGTTKILQLETTGLLRVRAVKVDLNNWADYVFKDGYELMPLPKLNNYIKEHGHLPNVPSEKDVATNGIELGEMNKILLEKIEELTLYLLQQEEKINQLAEEVILLRNSK